MYIESLLLKYLQLFPELLYNAMTPVTGHRESPRERGMGRVVWGLFLPRAVGILPVGQIFRDFGYFRRLGGSLVFKVFGYRTAE